MDTTGPMRSITGLEEQNETLSHWDGSVVQVWLYHVSLKRLAIRISQEYRNEDLYIVAGGCDSMHGPFSWRNSELRITRTLTRSAPYGEHAIISDKKNGFELVSSGVALYSGRVDHSVSFEDFESED